MGYNPPIAGIPLPIAAAPPIGGLGGVIHVPIAIAGAGAGAGAGTGAGAGPLPIAPLPPGGLGGVIHVDNQNGGKYRYKKSSAAIKSRSRCRNSKQHKNTRNRRKSRQYKRR